MKVDDKTYFEEEQRMDSRWMWFFVIFLGLTLLGLGITFLIDKEKEMNITKVSIVMGAIALSDVLIFYFLKTMKLEIAITKNALHYHFFAMLPSSGVIQWNDITSITFTKSPHHGYGKKYKFRYGEIYSMNAKAGIEVTLKNGKRKFFSLKDPDAFKSGFNKLNSPIQLNSELN